MRCLHLGWLAVERNWLEVQPVARSFLAARETAVSGRIRPAEQLDSAHLAQSSPIHDVACWPRYSS